VTIFLTRNTRPSLFSGHDLAVRDRGHLEVRAYDVDVEVKERREAVDRELRGRALENSEGRRVPREGRSSRGLFASRTRFPPLSRISTWTPTGPSITLPAIVLLGFALNRSLCGSSGVTAIVVLSASVSPG